MKLILLHAETVISWEHVTGGAVVGLVMGLAVWWWWDRRHAR